MEMKNNRKPTVLQATFVTEFQCHIFRNTSKYIKILNHNVFNEMTNQNHVTCRHGSDVKNNVLV